MNEFEARIKLAHAPEFAEAYIKKIESAADEILEELGEDKSLKREYILYAFNEIRKKYF